MFGEHLGKTGNAQALRGDEEKIERAAQVIDAGLARDGTIEGGVDASNAKSAGSKLGNLVFHQGDQRGDDEGGSSEGDGRKLVAERLPCPGWHDEEEIPSGDGGAADGFLVSPEAGESKNRLEQNSEILRIGRFGQERDLSGVSSSTLQLSGSMRLTQAKQLK
jgi:hypothetical protein